MANKSQKVAMAVPKATVLTTSGLAMDAAATISSQKKTATIKSFLLDQLGRKSRRN
jgi:hypothetical protein